MPIFLKAAINGARLPDQHPALPITAEAIALDAQKVVAAGASAVHFHIRDLHGLESLASADAADCITACRQVIPSTPLGVSTGAWIVPNPDQRLLLIWQWRIMPDFVSVNFHEEGAEEVADLLHERGVGIELGLSSPSAAERALRDGWGSRCLRVLLEPEETDVSAALANVADIERLLDQARVFAPRLLHGFDATAWPLLEEALRRRYQARIGLEDTLLLPNGEQAASNAQMVRTALTMQ